MYFKQFLNEAHGCASYLIASRQTNEAVVVDPAQDSSQYEQILAERGYTLRFVLDTHVHADHVSGARQLAGAHGAQLCLHESANVSYPFMPLADGDELALGQLRLRIMHTPGHRPELMSILVANLSRSEEPSMVLTGDSLLVGDVGRPDFGGGDATAQFATLRRLMELPDWVEVFPGHFEGPCGKGICGRPSTTIGFERRHNPMAGLNREAFVTGISAALARPLNMLSIEATNRGVADFAWAMPTGGQTVPEIEIDRVGAILTTSPDAVLLDVREADEYQRGHVPAAINLPQAELAQRLGELPKTQPLLIICESGKRSLKATRFLKQVGYANAMNVRGGTAAWRNAGEPLA